MVVTGYKTSKKKSLFASSLFILQSSSGLGNENIHRSWLGSSVVSVNKALSTENKEKEKKKKHTGSFIVTYFKNEKSKSNKALCMQDINIPEPYSVDKISQSSLRRLHRHTMFTDQKNQYSTSSKTIYIYIYTYVYVYICLP